MLADACPVHLHSRCSLIRKCRLVYIPGQCHIKFYIINAVKIGKEIGLGNRTNAVLQSAFFKLANVIPFDDAVEYMKKAILKSYGKKGEKVVNMNYQAVDCGYQRLVEVKVQEEWASLEPEKAKADENLPEFEKNLMLPITP